MTSPPDDTTTDTSAIIASLRTERDAALAREAALAEALATRTAELGQRNTDYSERIEHQSATIDVLKAMSASPGDAQPVFDLIVRRAHELCSGTSVGLFEYDGNPVWHRAVSGGDEATNQRFIAMFPMVPTRQLLSARAILDRQIVHVRDMDAEPGLFQAVRDAGTKSLLALPLLRDGAAIGSIALNATEPGGFSDSQIDLLRTFAEQAVIAISSAETYRNLHEALEQQTATADVLEVINSSPGNLAPVFDAMLEKAMRLCEAAFGALYTNDDGSLHIVATRGVPPAFANHREKNPPTGRPGSRAARVFETKCSLHILDVMADQSYQYGDANDRAAVDLGGARTLLLVPLLKEGTVLGIIAIYRKEVRAFSDKQIALLESFAAQAVIAMENARLLTEQREALEQQTATAEVFQVINANPGDLTPVFDAILEKAHNLCDVAVGSLSIYLNGFVHTAATRGFSEEYQALLRPPYPAIGSHQALMRGGPSRQTPDFRTVPVSPEMASSFEHLERMNLRAGLWVPLRKDGTALGCISAYRDKVQPFSEKEIALLENFAAQAVIAMENARLLTETREALEQQTATAEVLQVINSSPGDLTSVFDAALERGLRLCEAAFGQLWTYDGDWFEMVAWQGMSPGFVEFLSGRHQPGPGTLHGRLLAGEDVLHVVDMMDDELYRAGHSYRKKTVELGGARSSLAVALRKDKKLLGILIIYRQEVRPFTDKQIALLENFAAQVVIAMENARLLTETREALEQQTATAEVLQVINANPGNLTPVFDAMLENAMRLCEAGFGSLYTYDGDRFQSVTQRGVSAAYAAYRERHPPELVGGAGLEQAIRTRRAVQVTDMMAERPYLDGNPNIRAMVDLGGMRSGVVVPLCKDETALGVISVFRQEVRPFSNRQVALLESFAAQAVIAMDNARLINEQREALEQQTATSEVLQVINSSPGNLAPVFDAMLEKAMHLCGAAFGTLRQFDGEQAHILAARGVPTAFAERTAGHPVTPRGGLLESLGTGRPLPTLDIRDLELYKSGDPDLRAIADLGGARTVLNVPLFKAPVSIGYFTLYRQDVRAFTDKQIALLQNFAAQAVIAMENARLITETREALEQQTATAEVLQVINANPGNLAPVFEAMLEKAMRLCEAAFGSLYTYDGKNLCSAAQHEVPVAYAEFRVAHPPSLVAGGIVAEAIGQKRPIQVLDMKARARYEAGYPDARAIVDLGGARTNVVVPLLRDANFFGYISVYRQEVRPFTDKQIALLESFASQAVIAMENARLISEQREALEQQTATAEVLQVINTSPGDLAPVFDAMLDKAIRLCDATYGHFRTYDGEGFPLAAVCGDASLVELHRQRMRYFVPGPHNPISRFRRGERLIHISDAPASEAYRDDPRWRELVDTGACHSVLAVALRKDTVLLGYISVYRQEARAFSDKQIALLENFAAQAVIAVENARLLDEIRQRQEELRITFENMGDGVAMFDETQHLVAWNGKFQEIFDLPDALLGQHRTYEEHLRFLAARGDFGSGVDTVEQINELVASTGRPYGYERTRPDGRVIEIRRNPVPDGGFVLIFSDITERKRSEEEIRAARDAAETALRELRTAQANLIQAEKMASLGQLTAGIAHEIKNPLNFVNNFSALSTELIDELRDVLAPEPLGETARTEVDDLTALLKGNLEKVVQHGQRADGIVKAMLEHSRGSSGERRMVDLNALIDEALNLAYHGARAQDQSFNITLKRDFGEGIASIEVNPQDITRVFLNLFANGFYAATRRARDGEGAGFVPTLRVTTIDAGEAVEIRVRDNGTGIPADIRDKLFQPFFTTKPTGEGTGLGLSITYDIVTQQHGGSITVDSKVGEYSEFTIRLPWKP